MSTQAHHPDQSERTEPVEDAPVVFHAAPPPPQLEQAADRASVVWGPWSPAQLLAALLGGFLIVLGVLALSDTGFGEWTSPSTVVWGFGHTPLMAVIEIALGLAIIMSAPFPFSSRATLVGFGVLMTVFGVITLIEPTAFGDALGLNRQMGILYFVSGLGAALLGSLVPVFAKR